MDANRFETLLRVVNGSASRRGMVRTLAGLALGGTLGAAIAEGEAKQCPPCRTKKKGKCKGKKPHGTRCDHGRGVCQSGTCRCGGGPPCPPRQVCEAGRCFPQGTCPAGSRICGPAPSTACGDDCFCGLSAAGNTVCFESGGFCIHFTGDDCQTAAECSTCQTSADCALGQACIDVGGCCDDFLGRTVPLPAGAKTCVDACSAPDA